MKTVLSSFVIVWLSVILFTSCQKEVDPIILTGPQSDSSFLDKVVALDTTLPAGMDTTSTMFFTYDNAKRVTRVSEIYWPAALGSSVTDFIFTGNDTLPYKEIAREIYTGLYDYTDTTFYFYSNGVISKDSIITLDNTNGVIGAVATVYAVSGTNVDRVRREYNFTGGIFVLASSNSSSLTVVNTGGNIVTQTLVGGTNTFQSVQATYDTKPNPLYKAFKIKYPEFDTPTWLGWLFQQNNPANIQFREMGGPLETEVYTYTYRADGYPLRFIYSTTAGNNASNKVLFFYKTL